MLRTITKHCSRRLQEWISSGIMVGIALTITFGRHAIDTDSLHVMRDMGLTPGVLIVFFWMTGVLRMAALYANGHWPVYGPWCRFLCSIVGGFVWAQMFLSLVYWATKTGAFTIEVPIFAMLTVGEIFSAYRATNDDGRTAH